MNDFPVVIQTSWQNCGPTCIRIISEFYGKEPGIYLLEDTSEGVTLLQLSELFAQLGFKATGIRCDFDTLKNEVRLPCIAHWKSGHYVVVYRITDTEVFVSDPASGLVRHDIAGFLEGWAPPHAAVDSRGVLLVVEED